MLVTSGLKDRKDHLTLEWFVPTTNYKLRVTQISDREGRAKIAQRNPVIYDDLSTAEIARRQLERLAAEQGVQAITDFDLLRAEFWPEEESVDDSVRTMRELRRDSARRSIE